MTWNIYDKSKESCNWGVNNLYGWAMWQKLSKSYENTRKGYFFEADVQYPKKLHDLYNDLPFPLKI